MPECNRCDATGLVWGKTKKGYDALYELKPHLIYCKARPKASTEDKEMFEALTEQFGKRAKQLLPHAKGDTFEVRFQAVLDYVASES